MKLRGARYYRYALRLKRPLVLRGKTITHREGYLVALESADGATGYGEIAPLPGFSLENMESALANARHVVAALKKSEFTLDAEPYGPRPWDRTFASVRFGIETAILHLHAQAEGKSLARLLNPRCRDAVSLNALLLGSRDDVVEQAARRLDEGYRTFKLKIGRASVDEDLATVQAVREAIGDAATLRLDANQAWVYSDALRFARGLAGCPIQYVEEPLRDAAFLARLYDETGMAYAVDETLTQVGWWRILQWLREGVLCKAPESEPPNRLCATIRSAAAWVIKPTLAGLPPIGLLRDLADGAVPTVMVLSAAFESGFGLGLVANVAACLNADDVAAGLDTYAWLAEDVLLDPLPIQDAVLDIVEANAMMGRFRSRALVEAPNE